MNTTLPAIIATAIEDEQDLIGCILIGSAEENAILLPELRAIVRPHDFTDAACAKILSAIYALESDGTPIYSTTIYRQLSENGDLEKIGGLARLETLGDRVPTPVKATYHAAQVRRKSDYRARVNRMTFDSPARS